MHREVTTRLVTLLTAAFGLVAALAWNEAVKSLFRGPCGVEDAGLLCSLSGGGPWIYALLVTIIAVVATIWLARIGNRAKKPEDNAKS